MRKDKADYRILLIDDLVENLKVLTVFLENEEYTVLQATSGLLGLEIAGRAQPDLILLDIKMPEMDGYEVCRQLKETEELKEIPVIFISGMDAPLDKVRAFEVGGVDFITKPIDREELLARVQTHLTIGRLRKGLLEANTTLEEKVLERTQSLSKANESLQLKIKEHQQAEQALQASETRFRSMFKNTPVSILEEDFSAVKNYLDRLKAEGIDDFGAYMETHPDVVTHCAELIKIIDVNPAALKLHQARSKEQLLENLTATFTPSSYQTFQKELGAIWAGESQMEMDGVVQTLAGDPRYVTLHWRVAAGYEKTLSRVLVSLIDITERKRKEKVQAAQLRLIEYATNHTVIELLQQFLNEVEELTGSEIGFYHFLADDQETILLQTWSTNTLETMCTAEGEGLHYPVSEAGVWVDCVRERKPVIHNDYASLPHKQGLPEGHAPIIRELVVPVFRGEKIVAILGAGNKKTDYKAYDVEMVQQLADLAWEIVARIKTEEALRASEAKYADLYDNAPDMFISVDAATAEILQCNQTLANNTGYTKAEIIGRPIFDMYHPDCMAAVKKSFQTFVTTGEVHNAELQLRRKDGSKIEVSLNVSAIRDDSGNILQSRSVWRDITERKQVEDALYFVAQRGWTLEGEEFFRSLIQYLARTLGVDYVFIDELKAGQTEIAQTIALYALGEITDNIEYPLQHTPCEHVVGEGLCYYPQNIQQLFPRDNLLAEMEAESYMGVPLWNSRGEPIGLIAIMDRKPLTNTQLAESLLQIVAVRAAHELERKRSDAELRKYQEHLEELVAERTAKLQKEIAERKQAEVALQQANKKEQHQRQIAESLNEVAIILNSSLDLETVLTKIFEHLGRVIQFDEAGLFLQENEYLLLSGGTEKVKQFIGRQVPLTGQDPAARVFKQKQPVIIADVHTDPDWKLWAGDDFIPFIRGWMGAPLLTGDKTIGVLTIDSLKAGAYRAKDTPVLQLFANQAAIAIANARLFKAERLALKQAETLYATSLALGRTTDLYQALGLILTELKKVVPYDSASFQQIKGDNFEIIAATGFDDPSRIIGIKFDIEESELCREMARNQSPMILEDAAQHPEFQVEPHLKLGIRSWMSIPLLFGNQLVGRFSIDKKEPGFYTPEHARLAAAFASQAAIALENARLFNEAQQAQEAAEAANQAKSQFLSNMSHELRTPLNSILGFAESLQHQSTNPEVKKRLEIIRQSGDYLLTLINDILDLSKIEAGKLELYPQPLYLPGFLETIVGIIRERAKAKDLLLVYEADSTLPTRVLADEICLRQVLLNLLDNAIKFTDRGQVALRVKFEQGHPAPRFQFEVEDTGIGLTPAQCSRLFQPFEQVGDVIRSREGTGLGLAISRQLVQLMGGDIMVKSEPGQGSCFYFEVALPLTEAAIPVEVVERRITGYKGPQLQVLVVDDIAPNRAVLVDMLAPLGFNTIEAKDGQQALELAQSHRPDIILMDRWMPVMDGLEAIKRLRQLPGLQKTPIISISASVSEEDQAEILAAGCTVFLPKPINWLELAAQLQEHLSLEWKYEDKEEGSQFETRKIKDEEIALPPRADLEELVELTKLGSMTWIITWAKTLAERDAQYQPLSNKLCHLAEKFEVDQLTQLAQQYLNKTEG